MNHHRRSAQVWHVFSRDFTVLPAHPHVHPQSEWAITAFFAFPAAAGTHLPTRRDGRLSRRRCEVAQAEIRTRNLPIANPALYHTATSAPAVSIILVVIMLTILRCMFYTRKLNNKVSYRKQIARQHSCRKFIWPGQVAWSTVKQSLSNRYSLITMQNLVTFLILCAGM